MRKVLLAVAVIGIVLVGFSFSGLSFAEVSIGTVVVDGKNVGGGYHCSGNCSTGPIQVESHLSGSSGSLEGYAIVNGVYRKIPGAGDPVKLSPALKRINQLSSFKNTTSLPKGKFKVAPNIKRDYLSGGDAEVFNPPHLQIQNRLILERDDVKVVPRNEKSSGAKTIRVDPEFLKRIEEMKKMQKQ